MTQLNPNQFALPGMEEHAHAGAKHLAQGYRFEMETAHKVKPSRTDHTHELRAVAHDGRLASRLEWSGSEDDYGSYPGEIGSVKSYAYDDVFGGEVDRRARSLEGVTSHKGRGLASALFEMGHDPNVYTGNDTVPLHSPVRTSDGYNWSDSVGGWDPDDFVEEFKAKQRGEGVPLGREDYPDERDFAAATRSMHPRFVREDEMEAAHQRAKDPYVGQRRSRLPGSDLWGMNFDRRTGQRIR